MIAALLLAATLASPGRTALLVSNDVGLAGDPPLRFTSSDVDRMATVLEELGGFAPKDVRILENRPASDLLTALDELARQSEPDSLFFFYYSGHGDGGSLRTEGTVVSYADLFAKIRAVPAQLRVTVLDACQSGAADLAKGAKQGPAFGVQLDNRPSEGQVLISSSSADEPSFESNEYRGALFTLHWTAGLRGAADANGDGRVTLSEAYSYAYSHTLADTLLSRAGPQHPTFRFDLAGERDPVLTQIGQSARLTLHASDAGDYVLFDGAEREVIAEIAARADDVTRCALAPGTYVVRKRGTRELREARIEIDAGEDRALYEDQMPSVPMVRLARKGPLGDAWVEAGVGQYASGLGPLGEPILAAGPEWERNRWLYGAQLLLSSGTETNDGLQTQDLLVGLLASDLYTVRFNPGAFRIGPAAGIVFIDQSPDGRPSASSLGALAGGRLRLEVSLFRNFGLLAEANLMALAVPLANQPPTGLGAKIGSIGLLAFASYGLGARIAW